MMRSMYAAISGLKVHQTMLDVTSNDIANVNTLGYKSQPHDVQGLAVAAAARRRRAERRARAARTPIQVGLGVQLGSIDNNMHDRRACRRPATRSTSRIQSDGSWFRVGTADPAAGAGSIANIQYTRAGNFTRNEQGYLVTQDGQYVLGRSRRRAPAATDQLISIPPGSTERLDRPGRLGLLRPGRRRRARHRGLPLAGEVRQRGAACSASRATAGRPRAAPAPRASARRAATTRSSTAGQVEMSNVDLAQEFTNMISAQRGFQANSRVISTADQMLQDLVNLNR